MRAGQESEDPGLFFLFFSLPELILTYERALQPKLPEGCSTSKQVSRENDKS